MIALEHEGATYYVCPETGGVWLTYETLSAFHKGGQELEAWLDRETAEMEAHGAAESGRPVCPEDGTPLRPDPNSPATDSRFDVCYTCGGAWMQASDLDILVSQDPNAQMARPLSPEAAALLAQFELEHQQVCNRLAAAKTSSLGLNILRF